MQVTVALCTWNRSRLLDLTLTRLADLVVPAGADWELLVVNNNSPDDTDAVLARHAAAGRLPLRRLFEPKQGVAHARNCALDAARTELVVWTDDDVLVRPDWLAQYMEAAAAYPAATYFGGPIRPYFEAEPPAWVRRHWGRLSSCWAALEQGAGVGPLAPWERVFGANMAVRVGRTGGLRYDTALGRRGNGLLGGEETDYFDRLRADGHQGIWVGTAPVEHYLPKGRLTVGYVKEYYRCLELLSGQDVQDPTPAFRGAPLWLWWKYLRARLSTLRHSVTKREPWVLSLLGEARFRGQIDLCQSRTAVRTAVHAREEAPVA